MRVIEQSKTIADTPLKIHAKMLTPWESFGIKCRDITMAGRRNWQWLGKMRKNMQPVKF